MKSSDWKVITNLRGLKFGPVECKSATYKGEQTSEVVLLLCKRKWSDGQIDIVICEGHAVRCLENDGVTFFPDDESVGDDSVTHWQKISYPAINN